MSVPRRRMPAAERREYILEKAAEIFARKGYRMASVSDIVDEAGIGRGTFYLYFQSKKDIFGELIDIFFQGFALLLEENHTHLEEAFTKGHILATWRENIFRILKYHKENSNLTTIVYKEAMGSDLDFSARVERISIIARENLEIEFTMMRERGMLRDADIGLVVSTVMGATINIIMEHMISETSADLEKLADFIIEYNIRALIPGDGEPSRAIRSTGSGKRG